MTRTEGLKAVQAGAMPAPTWHFLNMNDTTIEIPEGLAIAPDVRANVPWRSKGTAGEFENALADAQAIWEDAHPAPTAEETARREEFLAAEADATYGGVARSSYQVRADALEDMRSLAAAFEHGLGDEVAAYVRYAAGDRIVVEADPGCAVDARIAVAAKPGAISAAAIDVVADRESEVRLTVVVDSPDGAVADDEAMGIAATTVRVFADADAHVCVERLQTLDDSYIDIDDMGLFASDDSRIEVRQTVLGAGTSFAGVAADLRGAQSCIDVDTRYLGQAEQNRDFNYSLRHHGEKSKSAMRANGVLAGKSSKTLRGTIDLVRGCKGAEGSEVETVLLVDDGVHNKTVPVILCNEDDVAGNHGATIGHIRDEQLFYLASRGLSQDAAERMFAAALIERAAIDAPDREAQVGVLRLGERLAPGFAGLFEG